jgi:hypothetical protein
MDQNPGEREHGAREDVDDNLLVDGRDLACAGGAPAEDEVAAKETGEEGVVGALGNISYCSGVRTPDSRETRLLSLALGLDISTPTS